MFVVSKTVLFFHPLALPNKRSIQRENREIMQAYKRTMANVVILSLVSRIKDY